MSCVVRGCESAWHPKCTVKFHSFPKDHRIRNAWLCKITLKGKFYESARICSAHFRPEDYDPKRPGYLLKNAVPFDAYQLCKCCNVLQCSNIPSSFNTTLNANVSEVKFTQPTLENNENEPSRKRRVLKDDKNNTIPTDTETETTSNIVEDSLPLSAQKNEGARPVVKNVKVQVNIKCKTSREENLVKANKLLQQQVRRQGQKIQDLKEIIRVMRKNITSRNSSNLQDNSANICISFKSVTN